jgi:hypothetical protein
MSSVDLNANVTIKNNKTLKKEYQVGDSLVYKNYLVPDGAGTVFHGDTALDNNGTIAVVGPSPNLSLGAITGTQGSYSGSRLQLERDKLGIQVSTANSQGFLDYGASGDVLTSGGSSGAMSWQPAGASLSANNTFTGTNTFDSNCTFGGNVEVDGDMTLQSALNVTDVSTHHEDIVIRNGTTTTVTLAKEGRIALGDNYGGIGQVLTSGGASGSLSWEDASGGTVESQFDANSTNAVSAAAIDTYSAQTYAKLAGGNTIAGSNTFSGTGNIFSQRVLFTNGFEVAVATPKLQVGNVSGSLISAFTSEGISNTRLEVDDGNLVVKGTHTTGSGDAQTTVKNAVYSDEYKNLSGQKIIVPSSTAFDPTEDQRTGTMKAIRNYIGTLIDIEPPVFAGGRFTSGGATTLTASVGDTFAPFIDTSAFVQKGGDINGGAGDRLGYRVASNSDGTIIAATARRTDSNRGTARVYAYSNSAWTQRGNDLDGETSNDFFGESLALNSSGTIVAVGSVRNSSYTGHVRVWEWSGSSWSRKGADIDGEASADRFGSSVSLSSDGLILASGAIYNDGGGSNAGHVRVFVWNSNTSAWDQRGSDIDGTSANDNSGVSVSLSSDGTILAVGRYMQQSSRVRVFQWTGSSWTQVGSDFDSSAVDAGYTVSISFNGTRVAVGNEGSGSAGVFEWSGSSWDLMGSRLTGNSYWGRTVSLSSDGTILGVGELGLSNNQKGSVSVFYWSGTSWEQLGTTVEGVTDGEKFGDFGVAVSGDGRTMVGGAYLHRPAGTTYDGEVRAFTVKIPVTCTDSPTAGPNKGTTQTFTLGADNFEFRNQIEGNLDDFGVPFSTSVVPIANVFTNLNNGAWQASSTFSTAGTYYLRYKATDAAGNDTPNDASHYLTVTVSS